MEKDDLSDTEQVIQQVPKPKRKLELSEQERKRRGDNLRSIVAKRKAENDKVNEIIKKDVDEVKHEVKLKAYKEVKKRVGKIKAEKLSQAESDSDSDSSAELSSSKKKRKNSKQPIIIIKNYTSDKKQYKEPVAPIAQEFYKSESEPIIQAPPVRLGYFV
jgi:hypothetical protein